MLSRFLTVREQVILAGLGLAIMVGSASLIWYNRTGVSPALLETVDTSVVEGAHDSPAPLIVPAVKAPDFVAAPAVATPSAVAPQLVPTVIAAVQGAVRRPGSYTLTVEGRVDDLIRAAGGVTLSIPEKTIMEVEGKSMRMRGSENALTLNLPQYRISSGYVPARRPTVVIQRPESVAVGAGGAIGLINLNMATKAELEALPGIGPTYAARIIQYRKTSPFRRVEDLLNVTGIGEKRFTAVAHLVCVQ